MSAVPLSYYQQRAARIAFRSRIAEAQNWRCCYCGERLELHTVTLEHVIPQCAGGPTHWLNCVVSCCRCNQKRGDRAIAEEIIARTLLTRWYNEQRDQA